MSEHDEQTPGTAGAGDWDAYWRGTAEAASYDIGGVRRAEIAEFWTELFGATEAADGPLRVLDVAAGSGAVVAVALESLGEDNVKVTCVDYSPAAIRSLEERYPNVTCCLADAGNIPLESGSFDIVASQFGVEYAGTDAVKSVSRLVAPGGTLALLMHYREGGIHDECKASVDAIQRMRSAQFIPLAIDLIRAGAAREGGAHPEVYDFAKRNMVPAVVEMQAVLRDHGKSVAGGTVQKLYDDVSGINKRVGNYDLDEVVGWLQSMDKEVAAYEGRMASMCDSAISATDLTEITAALEADGLKIGRADALQPNADWLPLAWALTAERSQ